MGGQTKDAGNSSDYKFMDPTGRAEGTYNQTQNGYNQNAQAMGQYAGLSSGYDPNAYMNQFMGQSEGLSNLVSGANAPLQQSLNAIASRQAALGSEAALAAMPGAANSGAGMAAFGQAYADPFAQAQAQLQQNQLQGTLGLWDQAMGQNANAQQFQAQNYGNMANMYGGLAGQNLAAQTQLASDASAWYQPTYQYQPGIWDRTMEVAGVAAPIAGAAMGGPAGGILATAGVDWMKGWGKKA